MTRVSQAARAERNRVIVLAEDDASIRELVKLALELDGHDVVAVPGGRDLIEQVQSIVIHGERGGVVDLLIADVRMPGIDGLLAVRILRDVKVEVPVILITAFADQWTTADAASHGAVLLHKPFELRKLRDVVRERLG